MLSSREMSMAEQRARKSNENSESRCGTIVDDIKTIEESRGDVEMGNEEDEEPSEAEIPRV